MEIKFLNDKLEKLSNKGLCFSIRRFLFEQIVYTLPLCVFTDDDLKNDLEKLTKKYSKVKGKLSVLEKGT